MTNNKFYAQVAGVGGASLSAFVADSVVQMWPWLLVMTSLILCDLVTGVCKAWRLGERVTFSRAIRDTTAKACTYYSCVVFVALFQTAANEDIDYSRYAAKVICVIEGVSILRNILKWHGYNVSGKELLAVLFHRLFGGEKTDYTNVLTEKKDEENS